MGQYHTLLFILANQCSNRYNQLVQGQMELLSSMLNIVKNVSDTDRQFKLLRQKLVFNIKKAQAGLNKYHKERHVQSWVAEHLESRLRDAREKLTSLDALLSSSQDQKISLKDKFKLNMPFNNERDKITQVIDDLKNATDEVINSTIPVDPNSITKKKLELPKLQKSDKELQIDNHIDQLYEMGPTIQQNNALDFAQQFTKNHTLELKIEALGQHNLIALIQPNNKNVLVEYTCERVSKQTNLELYKLGRLNFKKQYSSIKPIFPDIDKISKNGHFVIKWMRAVSHGDKSQHYELQNKKPGENEHHSQRKEQAEQFFSVPQVEHQEIDNGKVIIQKQNRSLYRKRGENWIKIEESWIEACNGDQIAVSLGKDQQPELFFKVTYEWK